MSKIFMFRFNVPRNALVFLVFALCSLALGASVKSAEATPSIERGLTPAKELHMLKRQAALKARQNLKAKAAQLRRDVQASRGTAKENELAVEEVLVLTQFIAEETPLEAAYRQERVASLIKNEAIVRSKRFELAAISANAPIGIDRRLSHSQRMEKYALVAWQLIQDFPEQTEAYESLLRIARDSDLVGARTILQRLITSNAPEAVKMKAREQLSKLDEASGGKKN